MQLSPVKQAIQRVASALGLELVVMTQEELSSMLLEAEKRANDKGYTEGLADASRALKRMQGGRNA